MNDKIKGCKALFVNFYLEKRILMKKNMIDSVNLNDFEKDEELRNFYNNLLGFLEVELDVNFYGMAFQYDTFRLFCFINADCLELAISQFIDTMYYIIDSYKKNKNKFREIMSEVIVNRDQALEFFWEFEELGKRYLEIRDDKYNFRKKAMILLKSFQELIENVIKREAILLKEVNIIEGYEKTDADYDKLHCIIENIFLTPTYDFSKYINNNLWGVKVNQFRNIVAHSNFKLDNEKIKATYGHNKSIELTIEQAEKALNDIYRLRIFIKLILNLTIDFMVVIYPELIEKIKVIPETAIVDSNSILNPNGMSIVEYEINSKLEIDEYKLSDSGQVYFRLFIESNKQLEKNTLKLLFLVVDHLTLIFTKENSLPELKEIIWVLNIKFSNDNKSLTLFISYDEIKLLISNPLGYAEIMAKKIEDKFKNNGIKMKKK